MLALVLALVVAAGCTSARKRESPTNLVGNLKFRDSETESRFSSTYRSGALYQDFRTVLLVDAVAMDQAYRRGYVAMLHKTYLLSNEDTAALQKEQDADFDSNFALLVFLFGGTNKPIPLGEQASPWKVLLQDDDGQMMTPATIEKLRPENPTYQYLNIYFYGLDRWAQAFKVSFPKLNKTLLGQRLGTKHVELVFTGLNGTVRLEWADPSVFYGPANAKPVTAPAAH